jgi:phosphoribosyl 1,2-cyclic phosphodiesterase
MHILPLASGSQGNSLLLEANGQRLLIDAGLEVEDLEARLRAVGEAPSSIDGVLMTHRHRDHRRGVAAFCKKYGTRVYGTRSTLRSVCNTLHNRKRRIQPDHPFEIGGVDVHPVALSHDAPETVGFRFDDGDHRFAMATDLGCDAGAIREVFVDLDALLLEFNYEPELLAEGPYSPQLRARVASERGHLSNQQAADLLAALSCARLQRVWVAHVSRNNNRPELALTAARGALGPDCRAEVVLAAQDVPSPGLWLEVGRTPTTERVSTT